LRVAGLQERGDAGPVMAPDALAEARALWDGVPPGKVDLEVLLAVGGLYLYRYLVGQTDADRVAAARYLLPAARLYPPCVAPDVLDLLPAEAEVPFTDPATLRGYGVALIGLGDAGAAAVLRRALAALPAEASDRDRYLTDLAVALGTVDPEVAIAMFREALAVVPVGHEDRGMCLANLADALRREYGVSGRLATLREAVALGRRAVAETPDSDPDKVTFRSTAGAVLMTWHEATRDEPVVAEAIGHLRASLAVRFHAPAAANLAIALLAQAASGAVPTARSAPPDTAGLVREAVGLLRSAVASMPAGNPERVSVLGTLAWALECEHEATGDPVPLDQAVAAMRELVATLPPDHPILARQQSALGSALRRIRYRGGDVSLLREAEALQRAAVVTAERTGAPAWPILLELAQTLHMAARDFAGPAALDEAVELLRRAVAETPAPDRHQPLDMLGLTLRLRSAMTGDRGSAHEAVAVLRQAVDLVGPEHPAKAQHLANLGLALQLEHEWTGDRATLADAVEALRAVVSAVPAGSLDEALALSSLGTALVAAGDTDAAVDALRRAVALTPPAHTQAGAHLANLAMACIGRYEDTGEEAALDEAIEVARQAVDATPSDHAERAGRITNLADALSLRHELTGDLHSLNEAIAASRASVPAALRSNRAAVARFRTNLGNALHRLYRATGDRASLAEAIGVLRQAVDETPAEHAERAVRISNLAAALLAAPGDEAVALLRDALANGGTDANDRVALRVNLASALVARAGRTGEDEDLDEAVEAARAALAELSATDPRHALSAAVLGQALADRRRGHDLDEAFRLLRAAMDTASAPPADRTAGALIGAEVAALTGHWQEALHAYRVTVELLPRLAGRGLFRADQERQLARLDGLACDAAAAALHAGPPATAVSLIEHGRVLLLGRALVHGELTVLREREPALAARLERIRAVLQAAS
jgi:tetratricopeptide (TPR) repeat protein